MSGRQQRNTRRQWKKRKHLEREREKNAAPVINITPPTTPTEEVPRPFPINLRPASQQKLFGRKRIRREKSKSCRRIEALEQKLKSATKRAERYRKQLQRCKRKVETDSPRKTTRLLLKRQKVNKTTRKVLLFHHVFLAGIRQKYHQIKSNKEKQLLSNANKSKLLKKYRMQQQARAAHGTTNRQMKSNSKLSMTRKKYDKTDLENAVSAVKQNRLKVTAAAKEYNVPKSTLSDRIRGRYKTTVSGPERQLTPEEEDGLVKYLLYMANQGFPLNRQMTKAYIQTIVKRSGRNTLFNIDKGPSNKWLKQFVQRHPELSERKPENQDKARAAMSNKKVMNDFFDFLESILIKYGVKDKPSQIFNCDETGFSGRETAKSKVIGPRKGHLFRRRMVTNDHITAHLCICTDGRFLPTMVIYQGSLPHRKFNDGIPDSWGFATGENGYMDTELFQKWFTQYFIPNCGRERPVVLIMDNCDSHISRDVVEAAIANDIVLVGLPGHTTHILQPLDVKVIGPLKSRFTEMTARLGLGGAGVTIGKAKFPIVLKHAIDKATPASIQESFAVTGICPFNPTVIDTSQLVEASFDPPTGEADEQVKTCEKCGHFLSNPLVKRGLIPESLADILLPPPVKPTDVQRKKRVVAEGRLISEEAMLKQLKEKEELEKKKVEDVERRKKEREMKREKRMIEEEEKREKKKRREEEKILKLQDKEKKQQKEKKKIKERNRLAVTLRQYLWLGCTCVMYVRSMGV